MKDIKYILEEKNGWSIVSDKKVTPFLKTSQAENELHQEIQNFQDWARSAKTTLYLNVSQNYRKNIEDCDTTSDACKLLEKALWPVNWAYHLRLYNQFMEWRLLLDKSIGVFSACITHLSQELERLGHVLDNRCLSFQSLRFHSKIFDHGI